MIGIILFFVITKNLSRYDQRREKGHIKTDKVLHVDLESKEFPREFRYVEHY